MNAYFYDIETLQNVFTTANFKQKENILELYYLIDEPYRNALTPRDNSWIKGAGERIYEVNKNFNGKIAFFDLHNIYSAIHLAETFGMSNRFEYALGQNANNPNLISDFDALPLIDATNPQGYCTAENYAVGMEKQVQHPSFRLTCDTDKAYQMNPELYPYLFGYNSFNYDTTILAILFHTLFEIQKQPNGLQRILFVPRENTASIMRSHNDDIFRNYKKSMPQYLRHLTMQMQTGSIHPAQAIRQNMILSGRHLDVARLNEKQQHVGLKRILGMLGHQIKESDKLDTEVSLITTKEDLFELFAYNTSDVVNLPYLLEHKAYKSSFINKKGLLRDYPELIYEKQTDAYAPDIRPDRVRWNRMNIDSSSAQVTTACLCPYGHLTDIPVVSFNYPSENKAKEFNIPRVNVLDECKNFMERTYPPEKHPDIHKKFDVIYRYYKSIEGHNYNNSDHYRHDYENNDEALAKYPVIAQEMGENARVLSKVPIPLFDEETHDAGDMTWFPYFDQNGEETSCFALFSTGGVHGAEYNKALYEADMKAWQKQNDDMTYVKSVYPNPVDLRKAKYIAMPDGRILPYKEFLVGNRKIDDSEYKNLEKTRPKRLKKTDKGKMRLHPKYTYTSIAPANHEDFTSYYPNLLRMMEAFFNKNLGYDRYGEIFFQKEHYGFLMKEKNADLTQANLTPELQRAYDKLRKRSGLTLDPDHISEAERELYGNTRNGTKLLLNSASGAADAKHENNIRVNNQIIAMRIIGQIFSFTIAAAQSAQGAHIISTNTDGLYSVMEKTLNNRILDEQSRNIHVDIEPEPMYLISKDTNNRIELSEDMTKIISASGGTVGCRKGPNPEKSLSHPAIIDWALSEYLIACAKQECGTGIDKPFNDELGREILTTRAATEFADKAKYLQMFQNILAPSTSGTISHIYGINDDQPYDPVILQHYNRVFIMKDNTDNTLHIQTAVAKKMQPAEQKRWKETEGIEKKDERIATIVLMKHNEDVDTIRSDTTQRIASQKVTNIEPEWFIRIENHSLYLMNDTDRDELIQNLDLEKYLILLRDGFTKNWMNVLPEKEPEFTLPDIPENITSYLTTITQLGVTSDDSSITIPLTGIPAFQDETKKLFKTKANVIKNTTLDLKKKTVTIFYKDLPFLEQNVSIQQIANWYASRQVKE